jgi:predicted ATP-dependent endonuclease of OLD family
MSVHTLEATNLGPIKHAQIRFGDLTVFVGPQATGKSILLQFLKLVLDSGAIVAEMKRQGLDWDNTDVKRRGSVEWVVIEEPEMGLHPRAISTVRLLVLELLSREYRVCISTHSPHILDLVWALKVFQHNRAKPEKLLELFEIKPTRGWKTWAGNLLKKEAYVYYFDPQSHGTKDISELDPGSEDVAMWGWGGLTEFSGRVGDVVADVVNGS